MDAFSLLPSAGNLAFTIVMFIVALSVIVAVHEYGHYIVGRWTGIKADVFSVGFGKVLVSRVDRHGTKWQIAALPFGGYVKFAGDANAASVGGVDVPDVDPRTTMLGAPLWARALTVLAGPVANFILAVLIFAGAIMWQGKPTEDLTVTGSYDLPAQFVNELQPGDRIIAVEDMVFGEEGVDLDTLPDQPSFDYRVIRDGSEIVVQGPHPIVPRADGIAPRSAADDAGIRVNDVVTAIDGAPIYAFNDIVEAVQAADGAPLGLTLWRDGATVEVTLEPRRTDEPQDGGGFETPWRIGVYGTQFFTAATEPVGPLEALSFGWDRFTFLISTTFSALAHLVTGEISTCNLSGPVGIAETSASLAKQGAQSFIMFIGMMSAAVGLLNLFPIPILDGGHLVFHAYEAITRRKPSDRALQVLMAGGLAILVTLMVFTVFNDLIFCP